MVPGCVDWCSGACLFPVPDTGQSDMCFDMSRCTCQFGCEVEDPWEPGIFYTFDGGPDMDYDVCTCHCTNGNTGEFCDEEMAAECAITCDQTAGCRDTPDDPSMCNSCIAHAHRNSLFEC